MRISDYSNLILFVAVAVAVIEGLLSRILLGFTFLAKVGVVSQIFVGSSDFNYMYIDGVYNVCTGGTVDCHPVVM